MWNILVNYSGFVEYLSETVAIIDDSGSSALLDNLTGVTGDKAKELSKAINRVITVRPREFFHFNACETSQISCPLPIYGPESISSY